MARSSASVTLTTLAALSMTFAAGCGGQKTVTADCVSPMADGRLAAAADRYCEINDGKHRWVYGGKRSGGYVTGGSFTAPHDATVKTRSGRVISRGGFGDSGQDGGAGS